MAIDTRGLSSALRRSFTTNQASAEQGGGATKEAASALKGLPLELIAAVGGDNATTAEMLRGLFWQQLGTEQGLPRYEALAEQMQAAFESVFEGKSADGVDPRLIGFFGNLERAVVEAGVHGKVDRAQLQGLADRIRKTRCPEAWASPDAQIVWSGGIDWGDFLKNAQAKSENGPVLCNWHVDGDHWFVLPSNVSDEALALIDAPFAPGNRFLKSVAAAWAKDGLGDSDATPVHRWALELTPGDQPCNRTSDVQDFLSRLSTEIYSQYSAAFIAQRDQAQQSGS